MGGGGAMLPSGGQDRRMPISGPGGCTTPAVWGVGAEHFGVGDKIINGPQVGPMAYITLAVCGVLNASQGATKTAMAHKWACCLHNPCPLRGCERFIGEDKIKSGRQVGRWLLDPWYVRLPECLGPRGKMNNSAQVSLVAT